MAVPVLIPRRRKATRARRVNPKVMKLAMDKIKSWPDYKAKSYCRGLAQVDPHSQTSQALWKLISRTWG